MVNHEVSEIMEKFKANIIYTQNKSEKTAKSYVNDLKMFFQYLVEEKKTNEVTMDYIKTLTLEDLEEYVGYCNIETKYREKKSAGTINRYIAAFRSFYNYLCKYKKVKENITKEITSLKKEKREVSCLSLDESKRLVQTAKNHKNQYLAIRNECMFRLFLDCCLRLSESAKLPIDNIDFEKNRIEIIGKGNKQRFVFFTDETKKILIKWLKVRKGDVDELFTTTNGKRISSKGVAYMVKSVLNEAGVDLSYSTHTLRHTGATIKHKAGMDAITLKKYLGHENIQTTQIYAHVDDDQLKKSIIITPSFG